MKRTCIHLTEQQLEKLKDQSEREGLTVSDLVRRALDSWYKKAENKA